MEGIIVESLTFTNTVSRIYKGFAQTKVEPTIETSGYANYIKSVNSPYYSPSVYKNIIEIPPINQVIIKKDSHGLTSYKFSLPDKKPYRDPGITITNPDGEVTEIKGEDVGWGVGNLV